MSVKGKNYDRRCFVPRSDCGSAANAAKRICAVFAFTVGAAVLAADDTVYTGCNVENSSYGLSCCAERNAIFHGAACGCRQFQAIAIVGDAAGFTMPCGACRQVMAEFQIPYVIVTKPDDTYRIMTLEELLPHSFSL